MRIEEVEQPKLARDVEVPAEVKALAKSEPMFQLAIDILAKGRDIMSLRDAGKPVPMSDEDYTYVVMETMRRVGKKFDIDPFVVYKAVWEEEWQQYRKKTIAADISEIDTLIDTGQYDEAKARIKKGRTNWRSKLYNKLSAKIKQAQGVV